MKESHIDDLDETSKIAFDLFKARNQAKIEQWLKDNPNRKPPIWRDPKTKEFKWLNRKERRKAGI